MTTSIGSLPPEILSKIFIASFDPSPIPDCGNATQDAILSPSVVAPPLLLMRICSYWRRIALFTPQLWSSLVLRWDNMDTSRCRDICAFWFAHSGDYPLDLWMQDGASIWAEEAIVTEEILKCIIPQKHRWRRVRLELGIGQVASLPPSDQPSGTLSLLESFDLTNAHETTTRWLILRGCTNLRHLAVASYVKNLPVNGLQVPWEHLTQVRSFSGLDDDQILQILCQCTNLTSANFAIEESTLVSNSYPPVILAHLLELGLSAIFDPSPMRAILGSLTLPNLVTLVYEELGSGYAPSPGQPLAEFLSRSRPPLRTLKISSQIALDDTRVIEALQFVPRLSRFYMSVIESGGEFFGPRLVQEMAASSIVPSLKYLELSAELSDASKEKIRELAVLKRDLEIVIHPISDREWHFQHYFE